MMILILFWWTAKTVAGSYMRVTMGDWLVWDQFLDPNVNQDTTPPPNKHLGLFWREKYPKFVRPAIISRRVKMVP